MLFSIEKTFSALFYVAFLLDCTLLVNLPKIRTDAAYTAQTREKRQIQFDTSFCTNEREKENLYCGIPANYPSLISARIVDGVEAKPFSYPYAVKVLVSYINQYDFHWIESCGGTIITNRFVLTAAQCVIERFRNFTVTFLTGIHYGFLYDGYGVEYKVYRIIIHPKYNRTITDYANDIALLETQNNIKFSCYTRKACYGDMLVDHRFDEDICVTVGWGQTGSEEYTSHVLHQLVVPIINEENCKRIAKTIKIHPGMMCAGYESGGHSPCFHDTGGPILCRSEIDKRFYIKAIVSFMEQKSECAAPGYVTIYTNVSFYNSWIDHVISTTEP